MNVLLARKRERENYIFREGPPRQPHQLEGTLLVLFLSGNRTDQDFDRVAGRTLDTGWHHDPSLPVERGNHSHGRSRYPSCARPD